MSKDSAKLTASVDSLKLSSKNTSKTSSKHASSESVLSRKEKESLQMQECKKRLLGQQDAAVVVSESIALRSPPVKKLTLVAPPINPEELAAATPAQRNWRGILIALLVIAAVLGLIVFSIALLTPAGAGGGVRGRRPTRADVLGSRFKPQPFNGSWISDTELVYRDEWGGLVVLNADNLTTRHLMSNSTFRELNAVEYLVSSDLKFVLLVSDVRRGYRYTRLARYHIYEVATRTKFPLSPAEEATGAPLLQYAAWSPDGGRLVFVHENDVYYKPRVLHPLVCRITSSGVPGVIYNGVPDYLYETQILRAGHALWFSGDGQHLMYGTFNASAVGQYRYAWYGVAAGKDPLVYPQIRTLRYPKANMKNPEVTIYTVNLKTPKFLFPKAIQPSPDVEPDSYVMGASWVSDKNLAVLYLNRSQNKSIINLCRAEKYICQNVMTDTATESWSSLGGTPGEGTPFLFARSGGALLTLRPVAEGASGAWRHVVYAGAPPAAPDPITMGPWEVTRLLAWDEDNSFVYFMATPPEKPGERHLHRVSLRAGAGGGAGGAWGEDLRCLTCANRPLEDIELTTPTFSTASTSTAAATDETPNVTSALPETGTDPPASGTSTAHPYAHLNARLHRGIFYLNETFPNNCLYNNIIFSKNYRYYIQECLGPEPPSIYLTETLRNMRIWILSGGDALRARTQGLAAPQPKVFQVEVRKGRIARVRLLLPPGLKESDDIPLPLVLQVDGSPGSQLVSEKFQVDWGWYLASTRNFIVAQIDARGSGFQGENLREEIYHRLLTVEVEDQIAVLTYLRDNLKMIDGKRVGVYGRGYGGAVAIMMAAEDAKNVTRCTAAIAPITDWTLYNSFFTERYLGPAGGERGAAYAAAGAVRRAGNLAGRALLLASAAADSDAHAQHTHALVAALVHAGALFRHHLYPDEEHDFEGVIMHLHRQLEEFFDDCFGPVDLGDWDVNGGGFFAFRE